MPIDKHPLFIITMTYKETTEYLFNQMPMFEKQGASGYKEGLYNTIELDKHFNHPHRRYKTIHVAGTNGKGSCSHTLAAFLQALGYKVGLYTSPHLKDFRERIKINGEQISEEYVVNFVEHERGFFKQLHPSFFEVTTAMAFKYFADMQIDIAVIEVGLGGRLDCTNIISPILSVITNISLDHTQFLGSTLQEIAREKAGIIKQGIPVVIGEWLPETRHVFEERAREMKTTITFAEDSPEVLKAVACQNGGMTYYTRHYGELNGELGGLYQGRNANTVLSAINLLASSGGDLSISTTSNEHITNAVRQAFANVSSTTGLMGRWQKVSEHPTTICDTGHNVGGWTYLSKQLKGIKCNKLHIIVGFVNDKDIDGILQLMPKNAQYYFTKPTNKRALSESDLKVKAMRHSLSGETFPTVCEAYNCAKASANSDDFIFIGGSSYVVADFLTLCL